MTGGVPPFDGAVAGTDYTPFDAVLYFEEGQIQRTVNIPILPRSGKLPNRRFTLTLSEPSDGMQLGSPSTAEVWLLNPDNRPPAVKLVSPKGRNVSDVSPLLVAGTTGDAEGIDRVELDYGGQTYTATLGPATKPMLVPWQVSLPVAEGTVALRIRAYDLSGNVKELSHSFDFSRRYLLDVTRTVPEGVEVDAAAAFALKTARGSASALIPARGDALQSIAVNAGAEVLLTAAPKTGHLFSHWVMPEREDVDFAPAGPLLSFTMPEADLKGLEAVFIANPWTGDGSKAGFMGLLTASEETPQGNGTYGSVSLNRVSRTGAFSGQLWLGGRKSAFTGLMTGGGKLWFKDANRQLAASLALPAQPELHLSGELEGDEIHLAITRAEAVIMTGLARMPAYGSRNPVPASLLNNGKNGYYTFALPSKAQEPELAISSYPQGAGWGTVKLQANGAFRLTGILADGTPVTASALVAPGDRVPLHIPLRTPGGKGGDLGGSLIGSLRFDPAQDDSDLHDEWLLWFRPAVAEQSGSGKAALATQIYTEGWPGGIRLDCLGARYDARSKVEAGEPQLELSGGGLENPLLYSNFSLSGGKVSKTAEDRSYVLKFTQANGRLGGSFTPDWDNAAARLPAFQGIWTGKGGQGGGWGFFLGNQTGNPDPQSGLMRLMDNAER